MTSLDKAMKMLLVAQNIIHEQEAKIKLLKYKHRKMKSKIYSLEQFIETAPLIKTERTHRKKEKSTQTTNEDASERNESLDGKCSSTVPLCDLVEKLELNTQPTERKRQSLASTSKDAISQTVQKTEKQSPIKQSQFGAIKRTTSNNTIDSKESIQIITNINSIETNYDTSNIENNALNEKFVSKVIDNIKQENNLDSFESAEEESCFNLENFLRGNEESNGNSITSSIFSNETELQESNVQKCIPSFDETIAGSGNLLPNEFVLNGNETRSTGSKFFFHNGEPATVPFTDLENSEAAIQNRDNSNVFDKFSDKILDKPLDYLKEHSLQANNSGVSDVVNFPSLVETNNSKNCDILADYSQTNYNMVNFELLENLSESQMDNMELFNDQELNLSEISNQNRDVERTDCRIEFSEPLLSPVHESELSKISELSKSKKKNTSIKKTTQNKCKKKARLNTRKYKKLSSGSSGYTSHSKPIISDNILNVRSIFNEDTNEEIINTEITEQTEQLQTSSQDQADELIRIVEEDQVEFFATDDKDTYIISLNSDMDPNRIKQLLNDGTLSIHVDDGDKQHTTEHITEEDYCNGINKQNIEDTSFIISKNPDKSWNHLNSIDKSKEDDVIIFINDQTSNKQNNNIFQSDSNISQCQMLNIADSGDNLMFQSEIFDDKQNGGKIVHSATIDKDGVLNLKNKNSFTCQMCKKVFHKKDNFKSHMATHNKKKKRHVCETCGEAFSWRSSLVRHTSSKHLPPTKCALCPALFPDASKVKEHMANKHLKEKTHECTYPDCGRKFFKKYNLTLHIRTHTKEQPYACSICDTTFGHISHKTRHERTHFTPIPSHSQKIVRYKSPAAANSSNNVTSHSQVQ